MTRAKLYGVEQMKKIMLVIEVEDDADEEYIQKRIWDLYDINSFKVLKEGQMASIVNLQPISGSLSTHGDLDPEDRPNVKIVLPDLYKLGPEHFGDEPDIITHASDVNIKTLIGSSTMICSTCGEPAPIFPEDATVRVCGKCLQKMHGNKGKEGEKK